MASSRPLYTAPSAAVGFAELSTSKIALARFTEGLHPEIVPSSVAKMKEALPECPPWETVKSEAVELKTIPVGAAGPAAPAGGGMATTRPSFVPAPLYSVERPLPLSETQKGLVDEATIPHGFTRFRSTLAARPGMSETKSVST